MTTILPVAPLQAQVFAALRTVLLGLVEPPFSGKGSIAGTTMTITGVTAGAITPGMEISGALLSPGTVVQQFGSGNGGIGTYLLSQAPLQDIPANSVITGGTDIVRGQVNRVATPNAPNYMVYWPGTMRRLSTNKDDTIDSKFAAAIADNILTVSEVAWGTIKVGAKLFGVDVAAGTRVVALGTGTGGVGTYRLAPGGQTISSRTLSCGTKNMGQAVEQRLQIDVHGPSAYQNAMLISTIFRDETGVKAFADTGYDVTPLHADDPRQIAFTNDQQQYEERWVVEACVQINSVVSVPQQFADSVVVGLIPVDVVYPP